MDNDAQDGFRACAACRDRPSGQGLPGATVRTQLYGTWPSRDDDTGHARETLSITGELDGPITAWPSSRQPDSQTFSRAVSDSSSLPMQRVAALTYPARSTPAAAADTK
jgi:hypothetical protein